MTGNVDRAIAYPKAEGILTKIFGQPGRTISAEDAKLGISMLKQNHRVTCDDKVNQIDTQGVTYYMLGETKAIITEFLSFIPKHVLDVLPKINVVIDLPPTAASIGAWNSEGNKLSIHGRIFDMFDENFNYRSYNSVIDHLRKTIFHELTHWVHLTGPASYKATIQKHFDERTADQPTLNLSGYNNYVGKDGGFWDPYMGATNTGIGVEIPTRCAELLADPQAFAERWNNPRHRETIEVFATILEQLPQLPNNQKP